MKGSLGILFSLATVFCFGTAPAFTQESASQLAVFYLLGDKPPANNPFRYLWNSRGAIGDSKNYTPMAYASGRYSAVDGNGKELYANKHAAKLACSAQKDPEKIARYLITAYTMKAESAGNVWITDGNFRQLLYSRTDTAFALDLRVYVNNTEKARVSSTMTNYPALFQVNLGKLRAGDTIYVAVGPGAKANDMETFYLYYKIKDIPPGEKPNSPLNEMCPLPDQACPRFDYVSGQVAPAYQKVVDVHNKRLLDGKPQLVILGDSLTNFWENEGKKIWSEKFAGYKRVLMGYAGDSTHHLLWRLQNCALDQVSPEWIVILIGSNNLTGGYSDDEIVAGNAAVIQRVKKLCPSSQILLLGLFPRNGLNPRINAINPKLASLAARESVAFADFRDVFAEDKNILRNGLYTDGTHLSEEGYSRYADALLGELAKLKSAQKKSKTVLKK